MSEDAKAYTKDEMMALLHIEKSSYYKLLRSGLLKSSRLWSGGPRVHTQQQVDDYFKYLNSAGQVAVSRTAESEFESRRQRRLTRTAARASS